MTINPVILSILLLAGSRIGMQQPGQAQLAVNVASIKGNKGKLVVCLYKNKDGFPTDPDKAIKVQSGAIAGNAVRIDFTGLEPGEYYISAFHDEKANGKPDRNFAGLPKEGVGMINDDMKGMRPDFSKGHTTLIAGNQQVSIQLRYIL